ncbi:MAG: TIR domain-containing protein [Chloroflexota bacterium]
MQNQPPQTKLCVCGRSDNFPLCDNSHEEEGWSCAADRSWNRLGFCASFRYQNLARKLASHYQAALVLPGEPQHVVERLITIVDGTDLHYPIAIQPQIQARQHWVVSLGSASGLLSTRLNASRVIDLSHISALQAFSHIRQVVDGDELGDETVGKTAVSTTTLNSAFISHAVKDEGLLLPAVHYLRDTFQADLFLCADSIPTGSNWQDSIYTALRQQSQFVVILTKAVLASHFCAFEIGMAYALNKPILILSLDGSRPPAFIQHIQAIDLPRIAQQKPWLTLADILLEELLRGLM